MIKIKKSMSKISIVGAGFVDAAATYALTLNQTASEIVLIDINKEKALGEVIDINHGLTFDGQMNLFAGDYSDIKDSDVIVIAAGVARKPGETRLELAQKNVVIAKSITDNIMKNYNHGVILVVSNPVDILTYFIQKWSGLPANMVVGSGTILDSARFRFSLSKRLNVDIGNVHGYIIGEHGDSQLPLWSSTHIAGVTYDEFCSINGIDFSVESKRDIEREIKEAGAYIIKNKGATYFAIATAVNAICESIIMNRNTIRTMTSVLDGIYGINNVALSVPVIINADGVKEHINLTLAEDELLKLQTSAQRMRLVIDSIEDKQ